MEDKPLRLSGEIELLLSMGASRPLQLREMIAVLHGRAYTVLLILFSLPFCQPIPLPGLSTALGAIIATIGLRLSLGQHPWLPNRLLNLEFSSATIQRLLKGPKHLAAGLERLLRPRLSVLFGSRVLLNLYGAMIGLSGFLLLLPLPIPLTNLIPGVTVLLLAGALLENDGYFALAGVLMFAVSLFFFGSLIVASLAAFHWLQHP